ncbi:E3 ubiquitin-protein ligase Topors-like [Sceloporus undulatus]|uniref:E3 ubiquitin-protein ligase Topors-like n=1 Tax=Sceloporus undulatus TaxID=8520 RepID=UPI001C4AB500|nr:E3 ubiquitin-protein ligase Topors-like [Sceloporus undulatus]
MRPPHKRFKPRVGLRSTHGRSLANIMPLDMTKNPTCALCLERIQDITYLNPCSHRFCFECVQKWSRKKVTCPLCKQHFHSFFHRVTPKGALNKDILPLNDTPFVYSESRKGLSSANSQRPTSPPDNGIVHNQINGGLSQIEKDIYQLMRQFAVSKRSTNTDVISLGKFKAQAVILFRRALYRAGILVRNAQNPDFNQKYFSRNSSCVDRLSPWLKRELKVLCGNQRSLIHTLQNFILNSMTQHDVRSKEFEALLRPHLHQFTSHFLHEFINFVRSPYNMKKYDWHASYECPTLTRGESDSLISSASSDDEHSHTSHNKQAPNTNSNADHRTQECLCSTPERNLPTMITKADSTNKSNNKEIDLEDLSNSDTENEIHRTDDFIKNKLLMLQPDKKTQQVGSLLDSQIFGCMEENEDTGQWHPVQTQNSKTPDACKNSSSIIGCGYYNAFSFNHSNTCDIKTMENSIIEETTQRQSPNFPTRHLRSSLEKSVTFSPSRKGARQKGRSRGMECTFEEDYITTRERPRGRSRARHPHEERHSMHFSRERRCRKEQRNSKASDGSLSHRTTPPLRSESITAGDVNKSKSQNLHHFRKPRSKDHEYFPNRVSSEPNWSQLYYRQDCERYRYEVPVCSKGEPTRFDSPSLLTNSRARSYCFPENNILIKQANLSKSWHHCSTSERRRSMGRSRGRFADLGQDRRPYDKKRRHKSHQVETEHSRGGKQYFQDYMNS